MRSPIHAVLWETWRVTRAEAAWKLAIGIVGAFAVLILCAALAPADDANAYESIMDFGAAIAMTFLVLPHVMGWLSLARLNSGRPGFQLYLHYSRPVRTAVIVGLPMVYLTALSSTIYLVSALLLRVTSGYAFPLLPVAAWMAALTLVGLAATWATRNRTIQVVVMVYALTKGWATATHRLTAVEIPDSFDWPPRLWPTLFDFPLTDYALIAVIALACFGVTVAGVTRQRRGEGWAEISSAQRDGFWGRLVNLFRFRCPTLSAMRAQIWFDLKSNGFPVLTIGVALAIVILLLSAVGGPIDAAFQDEIRSALSCGNRDCFYARPMPVFVTPVALLIVLFLGGNAFGIRRKQGSTYVSAFEATQAYGTAQLAALKLLVKSLCLLGALLAVGVSVWTSLPLLGDAVFIQMFNGPLSNLQGAINGVIAKLTGYELLALAIVAAIGLVVWVAYLAVLSALWVRYSRRANIAASALLLSGIALALLALAERKGIVSPFVFDATLATVRWTFLAAMVLTTVYVSWSGLAERVLTIRYVSGAVAISATFGAAWLTLLHVSGAQLAAMPVTNAVEMLSPLLLPLVASVLAPWSLSRIRHA